MNHLFFDVLPALNPDVHVHINDVFYSFEYPKEWVMAGRSWNELYVLRAFLQFNTSFAISMMNSYLMRLHPSRIASNMPLCLKNSGGSIWLLRK